MGKLCLHMFYYSNRSSITTSLAIDYRAHGMDYVVTYEPGESSTGLFGGNSNWRRRGMKKLLALIGERAVDVVLIEYPDRLVRFGFGYLEQAFTWKDVRLEVLDPPKHQEPTEELIQDMLTIVTVFAGRLYGHRAQGVRKRVETVLKECEQEEQAHGTGEPHQQAVP